MKKCWGATDTVNAPWHLIAADDGRNAQLEVFRSICETIERVLEAPAIEMSAVRPAASYDVLSKVQPYQEMSKEEYKDKLENIKRSLLSCRLICLEHKFLQFSALKAGMQQVRVVQ